MAPTASRHLLPTITLLLVALLLLCAGLYNGFPLVTSDSGTYINSAIHYDVPNDRPIVYGLFIRFTGLEFSLWLVILVQALILGWLLLRHVSEFASRITSHLGRLALVGIAVWTTGVSWYCSQLMPDIFTPIGLLALGLLLLGRFRSRAELVGLLLLTVLSATVHNSNLLTFTLVVFSFGALAGWQQLFKRQLVGLRHWLLTTATVLACWVILPSIHAAFGGGFVLSRASPVFLLARMVEAGIIDKYLDNNCDAPGASRLCESRDKLPNDAITFLWDENSPYNKSGGIDANLEDYRSVVNQIMTTPRYYPYLLTEGIQGTLRQLTHVGHGDGLTSFRENSNPYWKVQEFTSYELKQYLSSLQNRSALDFKVLNERTYAAQFLALLVVVAVVAAARRTASAHFTLHLLLLTVIGLGLVANAFVTGALANVLDRLQGRVAWLLPFVALILAAEFGPDFFRYLLLRLKQITMQPGDNA
jgi:hypothetical protein